jgi:hypothetical protein
MKIRKSALSLVALLSWASACSNSSDSNSKPDYAVPDNFCGIHVDRALYEPLFPPGTKLEVDNFRENSSGYLDGAATCIISVDESDVILVETRASESGYLNPGVDAYIDDELTYVPDGLDISEAEQVTDSSYEVRVWPNFAAAYAPCRESSQPTFTGLNISVSLDWLEGDQDYGQQLSKLISPLMDAIIAKIQPGMCRPA